MEASTFFPTEKAGQYLATLCKHFGHKVPVEYDAQSGRIQLPFGHCDLKVHPKGLAMKVVAGNRADLEKGVSVITSHLERFAFRENPQLDWAMPDGPAAPAGKA